MEALNEILSANTDKDILIKVIDNVENSIVYNVNFGHATPRCALQYGAVAKVDMKQKNLYE